MKHRDKCPRCAFMYAARNRYQSAGGKKDRGKVFDDIVMSAAQVAGLIMSRLDTRQKAAFMCDIIKASGDDATSEIVGGPKGPTLN